LLLLTRVITSQIPSSLAAHFFHWILVICIIKELRSTRVVLVAYSDDDAVVVALVRVMVRSKKGASTIKKQSSTFFVPMFTIQSASNRVPSYNSCFMYNSLATLTRHSMRMPHMPCYNGVFHTCWAYSLRTPFPSQPLSCNIKMSSATDRFPSMATIYDLEVE